MTPKEREEALARLAAVDVASMTGKHIASTAKLDNLQGLMRVMTVLKVPPTQAENVYGQMVNRLKDAELTVNFSVDKFYNNTSQATRLLNAFETPQRPGYMTERKLAEERLFDYSNAKGKLGMKDNEKSVIDRIKKFGSQLTGNNPSFASGMRPRYAAVNFKNSRHGAAGDYGASFMVLKDHVKLNCTLLDRDSFNYRQDAQAADKLANYAHPDRIILNMRDNTLKALYKAATGNHIAGADVVGLLDYVEAQIHSPILFNRDVKRMYVSNVSMSDGGKRDARPYREYLRNSGGSLVYRCSLFNVWCLFGQHIGSAQYIR
ncbi:DUF3626 domain-containing protein [Chitinophaga pinensis]|nr:DUF3626 domain-containing protein [Chitinophaga pinensis]